MGRDSQNEQALGEPFRIDNEASVFHVLRDNPCPYLEGQTERKLLTELQPGDPDRYDLLSRAGFRRSHSFAYRPACKGCTSCVPVRVPVRDFSWSRSQKRIWRKNLDLKSKQTPAVGTAEQFALFSRYLKARHDDGEMVSMTLDDYRSMVEQTIVDSRLVEFRDHGGRLVAVLLMDWMKSGASAVYSFFHPEYQDRSPGTFMILWMIEAIRMKGLSHAYLGYWIAETHKMSYKQKFRPIEAFGSHGWQVLTDESG